MFAAAIRCGAQHIITENLNDFPAQVLKQYGIEAVNADTFVSSTFELYPTETLSAMKEMRMAYDHPPMNSSEFLRDLMRVGLGKTAAMAKANIEFI